MIRRNVSAVTAAFLVAAIALPATAAPFCAPREQLVAKLEADYGERQTAMGLRGTSAIFEIWTSEEKGTWTVLMTRPDGMACPMAAGTDWRDIDPTEVVLGDPT